MSSNLQFPNLTLLSVKDDQMQLRKKTSASLQISQVF